MNGKFADGDAAFALHVRDIIKGDKFASNKRCSDASFESRQNLFNQCSNLLLVPGDNEWNDCAANEKSPFHQFTDDFPSAFGGGRPHIVRHNSNPEILFLTFKEVGVFGLNLPAGDNYIKDRSSVDINAQWVEEKLDKDRCNLKSIVLFGQIVQLIGVNAKLHDYYNACSTILTLVIIGNGHPTIYCMKKSENRFTLTVEASQSGPLLVSIVHDTDGLHFFHVKDKDLVDSNQSCPELSMTD